MPLLSIFELIVLHRWAILAALFAIPALVFGMSTALLHTSPTYVGTSKVSILPTNSELAFAKEFVRGSSQQPANLISATHSEYLTSRPVAQKTIDRLTAKRRKADSGATVEAPKPSAIGYVKRRLRIAYNYLNSGRHVPVDAYESAILALQKAISVKTIEGTYILRISVSWDDPNTAAEIANMLSEIYVEELLAEATKSARELETFLTEQMRDPSTGPSERAALQSQMIALRLATSNARGNLRLVEPATPRDYPNSPKAVKSTFVAIAFTIALALFIIVALDTFSSRLRTLSDLKAVFGSGALGPVAGRWLARRLAGYRPGSEIARKLDLWSGSGRTIGVLTPAQPDAAGAAAAELKGLLESTGSDRGGSREIVPVSFQQGTGMTEATMPGRVVIALRRGEAERGEIAEIVQRLSGNGERRVFGFYWSGPDTKTARRHAKAAGRARTA